jgi:hypothetical protein
MISSFLHGSHARAKDLAASAFVREEGIKYTRMAIFDQFIGTLL